eukprot:NODE_5089_length_720_cov_17.815201_g4723_i0.p1 GENE.NODE_5089_length_720_cov_17.815201_g4723_i0~~NODE_5089_length_720_cov_17.815201_g4723_i0.p1  ORF type:complete len:128 (+),score=46.08 NODE_5089_length_720_cov_17.815201_g4723_i0:60-386(+)
MEVFAVPPTFSPSPLPAPTSGRPVLRSGNDNLDKLTELCVEKIDIGLQHVRALLQEIDTIKADLKTAHAGGDPELRTLLQKANKEIHRLSTLAATCCGRTLDAEELGF